MQIFLIILFSSLLVACSSKSRIERPSTLMPPIKVALPSWVLDVPPDTAQFLYGIGSGVSQKKAKQEALVDLSSKLGVYVKAETEINVRVKNRGYEWIEKQSSRQISTKVLGLTINQYQIEASYHPTPMQFHVLLKTDKHLLLKAYQDELKQAIKQYRVEQSFWRTLGQYERYQKACAEIVVTQKLQRKVAVIKVLNATVDLSKFQQYRQQVQSQYLAAKQQLKFQVSIKNPLSQSFSQPLRGLLAKQGLSASQKKALKIQLSTSVRFSQSYGFYIGRYLIKLDVYQGKKLLGNKQFTVKGVSAQNKADAKQQAIKKFTQLLNANRLQESLGLPLTSCDLGSPYTQ